MHGELSLSDSSDESDIDDIGMPRPYKANRICVMQKKIAISFVH